MSSVEATRFLFESTDHWSAVYALDTTVIHRNKNIWRSTDGAFIIFYTGTTWIITDSKYEGALSSCTGGYTITYACEPYEGGWNIPCSITIVDPNYIDNGIVRPTQIQSCVDALCITKSDTYEFSIFYTFIFNANANTYIGMTGWDMLILSIASALREFGNRVQIILYTTCIDDIVNRLSIYPIISPHVDIRFYNHVLYENNDTICNNVDVLKHFNDIGHARIFVIDGLLRETKKPVIYLDNDTVINKNAYTEVIKLVSTAIAPISCCIEQQHIFKGSVFNYTSHQDGNLSPVNNGIIIYPYNDKIFDFIRDTVIVYNNLKKIKNYYFNDMFAHTIVCNRYKYLDTISCYRPHDIPYIFHYYCYKYEKRRYNDIHLIRVLLDRYDLV